MVCRINKPQFFAKKNDDGPAMRGCVKMGLSEHGRQEYEYGSGSTLPVKWLILYHVYVDHPKNIDPAMG